MRVLEIAGICVAALLVLLFLVFFRRRLLMAGGGTIRLQVRTSTMVPGRGWSPGLARFVGDEFRFYKMFSYSVRPKRILDRRTLSVDQRRLPQGPERLTMPGNWVILTCSTGPDRLDIAMAESTVTGLSSWLEAGPPGSPGQVLPRPYNGPAAV